MKRILKALVIVGFFCLLPTAFAQFTTVTGTVTDPNGLPYAFGTISATLILPGGTSPTLNGLSYTPPTQPVGLDKNGAFSFNVGDNTQLSPAGTKWNFLVCSAIGTVLPAGGKGPVCFSLAAPITISGASQNISAQLNAVALPLSAPGGIGIAGVAPGSQLVSNGLGTPPQYQAKPSIDVRDFGTFGDNTSSHTITAGNIAAHTEWLGCGTVNTAGTAVTWVSGAQFYPILAAYPYTISIAGTSFTVASVGTETNGVATTMVLNSTAGTQTGARWCIYASGDQWDYVAIQESVFTALGAPGLEHRNINSWQNRDILIPSGSYFLNKGLILSGTVGAHLRGAQRLGATLTAIANNMPLFISNGFAYSKVEGIQWTVGAGVTSTTNALIEQDWDNNSGSPGLQANSWEDNLFTANAAAWAIGFRTAKSGFMGSENLFKNDHWLWFTAQCYYQSGANALDNTFLGGNFQNCSGDGIRAAAGSVDVYGVGFQNGTPISALPQTGCDITFSGSANDTDLIGGVARTESGCFVRSLGGQQLIKIDGGHQNTPYVFWTPNTPCSNFTGTTLVAPPTTTTRNIGGAFQMTTASGNTGGSEPNWTYTTTTDNACTWTYVPIVFYSGTGASMQMQNSSVQLGSLQISGSANGELYQIENNVFSHADWLNPNAASPYATNQQIVQLDNNVSYPGGGLANGGPAQTWGTAFTSKAIQAFNQHNFGPHPLVWSSGTGGTQENDVGLGPGRNPLNTSVIAPESILAVISPAAANVKFGRLDAFGSNMTGTDQDIAAGRGTGTGPSGNINFWTHGAGGSGVTLGTLVNTFQMTNLQLLGPLGTAANPTYSFLGKAAYGVYERSNNVIISTAGSDVLAINGSLVGAELPAADWFAFSPSSDPTATPDSTIARIAPKVFGFGVAGDTTGTIKTAAYMSLGTKFTSNAGCTEGTLVGGATAGKFTVGQNTACTIIITMGNAATAPNGWTCTAYDQTAVPAVAIRQTSSTTTTCSLLMTVATNDVITFSAIGF